MKLCIGLSINKQKGKVFLAKVVNIKIKLLTLMGVPIGTLSVRYIDLPLTSLYPKTRHFFPLINKVRGRIEGWELNSVSFAGRTEMVKCVLHNVVSYWAFSFKLPNTVLRELERLFSNFIWNNKML